MIIKEMISKTALSSSKLPGLDYALNPYLGCGHQCRYCYVPSVLHLPRQQWEDCIYVKRNLPLLLAKELPKKSPGVIGLSTVTDPYQAIEQTFHVTHYCLEQLIKYDFPVHIQTKSDLVLNDVDLIEQCFKPEIMISIGTVNDKDRNLLEPYSSPIEKRLMVLEKLKDNNLIKTSVFLGPLYPNMNWDQIKTLLDKIIENKISSIMIDNLHLKPGLQTYLSSFITQNDSLKKSFTEHVFNYSEWNQHTVKQIKRYINEKSKEINPIDAF